MTESKFIELLNLYVDREITPEEVAVLEQEILNDPKRRAVYRQYCQMHRACALLQDHLETHAGQPSIPSAGDDQVVAFPAPRRGFNWVYWGTGLAAAACVTLIAVRFSTYFMAPASSESQQSAAATSYNQPAAPLPASVAVAKSAAAPASGPEMLVTMPASHRPQSNSMLTSYKLVAAQEGNETGSADFSADSLKWLGPLPSTTHSPSDAFAFKANQAISPQASPAIYRNRGPNPQATPAEMTAFQFQR